jgi:hypothetical protein
MRAVSKTVEHTPMREVKGRGGRPTDEGAYGAMAGPSGATAPADTRAQAPCVPDTGGLRKLI